jgi:glucose-6-phosphate 1-dehydrogenase
VAKAGWTLEQLKTRAKESITASGAMDDAAFAQLVSQLSYVDGDYKETQTYVELRKMLGSSARPLHYLAIPPALFPTVVEGLASSSCATGARIVVEKPFGRDLDSAVALNNVLRKTFSESAIFRIDHFLGKEPVQNILYTRFANSILEPVWNHDYIRAIQITMAETVGVQGRGQFYDDTGALRDVVQNHLLQVFACLAMEPPESLDIESTRDRKTRVLESTRPLSPNNVVRGQFVGYREEKGVASTSTVETFAAVKMFADTPRWAGVPFYIRSGKRLPVTATEVIVEFRQPVHPIFVAPLRAYSNHLRLRLDPEVIIELGLRAKLPGETMAGEDVDLIATRPAAGDMAPYERLLDDAIKGDQALFANEKAVEAQWRIVDPILGDTVPCTDYSPDTWGPTEADRLIEVDGAWTNPLP